MPFGSSKGVDKTRESFDVPKLPHIHILGGGFAGLALGYYARKNGFPFTIYEADATLGGNAVTFEHEGFLYDSGAHRFHDRLPLITREIQGLLGSELESVHVPSRIVHR